MADRKTDLHKTGRVNTKVETQTQVVDHTEAPASRRDIEYHSESIEIAPGTTLVTYGEPVDSAPAPEVSENEDA